MYNHKRIVVLKNWVLMSRYLQNMRLHLEINGTIVIDQLNICCNRKVRGGTLHVYTKCSKINLIK